MNIGTLICLLLGIITFVFAFLEEKANKLINEFVFTLKNKKASRKKVRVIKGYNKKMLLWTIIMTVGAIFSYTVTQVVAIAVVTIWLIVLLKNIGTFKKLEAFVKKRPFFTMIIVFFILIIIPPLVINWLYKIPAFWKVMEYENNSKIPAGTLLSYWGTVLTFCATFTLSMIIYIQNKENNINNKLVINEAIIDISDNSITEITINDLFEGSQSMLIKFNVRVLSKATISYIFLKSLSIMYGGYDEVSNFLIIIEPHKPNEKVISFQRREVYTEFSTSFIEITNEQKTFLESKDKLKMRMEIEIVCNDVITPVNITLNLKKQSDKITMKYFNESINIYHYRPKIKKNN